MTTSREQRLAQLVDMIREAGKRADGDTYLVEQDQADETPLRGPLKIDEAALYAGISPDH